MGAVALSYADHPGDLDNQQRADLDLPGLLMTLADTLLLIGVAGLLGLIARPDRRLYFLLGLSALAVFAFQPALPIRGLDFWLPTATLSVAVIGWALTAPRALRTWRNTWLAALILGTIVLALALTRYINLPSLLTASLPPQIELVVVSLLVISLLVFLLVRFTAPGKTLLSLASLVIIGIFLVLKTPALAIWAAAVLRGLNGQSTRTATAQDLSWLGFSYIAFRLLHTLRDRQTGRMPPVTLAEYVVYMLFFPALTAGPIDRIERFLTDLRRPLALTSEDWSEAGKRVVVGLFKKFVLADSLALIALNGTNALQVRTSGWTWVLLYAFAFQIYFDFSGYTDIAIGLGRLLGIRLPENFAAPYLKPNLTQFWNSWHMTLTQWFRSYFFNPLTRALRSAKRRLPTPVTILFAQISTMVLIGLWHGVAANFVLWGLWHGAGLFVNNRWSEFTRPRLGNLPRTWTKALEVGSTLLTFNYVALGWVFFALPDPATSWHVFLKLFGLA
ncbi:MAG: MBOAT family O-acyltransferase [Anaerolineales bacterium]